MDNLLVELGVGGIFALLIIREVLPAIRRRNGNNKDCAFNEVCRMRHDTLKGLIKSVNENISAQTVLLREICKEVLEIKGRLK